MREQREHVSVTGRGHKHLDEIMVAFRPVKQRNLFARGVIPVRGQHITSETVHILAPGRRQIGVRAAKQRVIARNRSILNVDAEKEKRQLQINACENLKLNMSSTGTRRNSPKERL